jgi:2-polyprenyl-3-methyl-5-hydroxy-6-metoxy-1,4-benzoquinol methylase
MLRFDAKMYFQRLLWDINHIKTRLGAPIPTQDYSLNALMIQQCGNCNSKCTLREYFTLGGMNNHCAKLYICVNCLVVYDASQELNYQNAQTTQTNWEERPEMFATPSSGRWNSEISKNLETFKYLEHKANLTLKGTMLDFGAGSGLRAVAGLQYFTKVLVYDHVSTKLEQLQKLIGLPSYEIVSINALKTCKVDFVFCWHVLEHLIRPGNTIHFLSKLINNNGYLVIQVPLLTKECIEEKHYYFQNEISITHVAQLSKLRVTNLIFDNTNNYMTVVMKKCT